MEKTRSVNPPEKIRQLREEHGSLLRFGALDLKRELKETLDQRRAETDERRRTQTQGRLCQ